MVPVELSAKNQCLLMENVRLRGEYSQNTHHTHRTFYTHIPHLCAHTCTDVEDSHRWQGAVQCSTTGEGDGRARLASGTRWTRTMTMGPVSTSTINWRRIMNDKAVRARTGQANGRDLFGRRTWRQVASRAGHRAWMEA
jgi:hypothetical protein